MEWKSFTAAPGSVYETDGDTLVLTAPARSDFVCDAVSGDVHKDGAFLYREVEGDFVIHAKVSQAFASTYDAPALLALESDTRWVKACFEATDLGTRAVVSVFTDGHSDDCCGVETEKDYLWLQLVRRGDVFAVHYSLDGGPWKMHRIARVPLAKKLKVGFEAQCPLGEGGRFRFEDVSLEQVTKEDLRGGN